MSSIRRLQQPYTIQMAQIMLSNRRIHVSRLKAYISRSFRLKPKIPVTNPICLIKPNSIPFSHYLFIEFCDKYFEHSNTQAATLALIFPGTSLDFVKFSNKLLELITSVDEKSEYTVCLGIPNDDGSWSARFQIQIILAQIPIHLLLSPDEFIIFVSIMDKKLSIRTMPKINISRGQIIK